MSWGGLGNTEDKQAGWLWGRERAAWGALPTMLRSGGAAGCSLPAMYRHSLRPFAQMSCWGSSWQKNFPPNKVLTVQPSPASNEPGVDFPPCQPRALSIPVLPSPLCCQLIFFNFLFFFLSSLLDGAVVKALNNRLHLSGARQPASWRQFSLLIHFQGS